MEKEAPIGAASSTAAIFGEQEVVIREAPSTTPDNFPGGGEVIRLAMEKRNVPTAAISLIISSITESTLKQYSACLRKYWKFCTTENRDPLEYNLETYIQFITQSLDSGMSYSAINSYRSALNFILIVNPGDELIIKRCIKGVYNLKPPTPKYSFTWDPDPVLKYLASLYPLNSLSLEMLTTKMVTLIALTTAHRVQTISKISIDNIIRNTDKIQIKISERIKTSGPNKMQPILVFPYFTSKPGLCVASTIDFYLSATSNNRGRYNNLVLTHRKPIHPASPQTISRWILSVLKLSGVNTDIFNAHSVRHAATSAAYRKGVNIDTIKNTAGWTPSSSTFFNFYNRPVRHPNDTFALEILGLGE